MADPMHAVRDPARLAAVRRTALVDTPAEEAFDRLTHLASKIVDVPIALVSIVTGDREFLKSGIGIPETLASRRTLPLSHSFCKHVVAGGQPLVIGDAGEHPLVCDNPAVEEFGVRAYIGIPLQTRDGDVLGSLCVFDREPREWTEQDVESLTELAASVMTEIELRVDAAERKQAEERAAFLADVSAVLASSLDYARNVVEVARRTIPRLADACIIDFLAEDGTLERIEVGGGGDAETTTERHQLPPPDPRGALGRVLRAGDAELVPELGDAPPDEVGKQLHERLRELDARAAMIVPLRTRGQTLGAVTFIASGRRRHYDTADLRLAEELAGRIAGAVDNARLYEASVAANRARSDFLAVMSHELRTPLNAIIGYADLLASEIAGPLTGKQDDQLGRIRISADHLLEMIEEILTVTRMEAGKEELRVERIALSDMVDPVAAEAESLADAKDLEFGMELPDDMVALETDADKLRQILRNLVSNAIKFTDEGEVRLSASNRGERVCFQVRDTGIGIPEEHQEEIFKPFWQIEQAKTRRAQGTGLGLSVARRLARLLGGDVTVESTPGEGTTFTVGVPRRVDAGV